MVAAGARAGLLFIAAEGFVLVLAALCGPIRPGLLSGVHYKHIKTLK